MGLVIGRPRSHYTMLCIIFAIFAIQTARSYNLEAKLPLFKHAPIEEKFSTFGFSVAQHRLSSEETGAEDSLLVVGAPTAGPIRTQLGNNAPKKPGGVFYCPVTTRPDDCIRVQMDEGGNSVTDRITHSKDNQWLGVSLKSQGPGKFLVSCAHRYTQLLDIGKKEAETERLCGKCFLLNATSSGRVVEVAPNSEALSMNFISRPCSMFPPKYQDLKSAYAFAQAGASIALTGTEYLLASPCNQFEETGRSIGRKKRYSYMQAGSSIALENEEYVMGAPGAYRWSGALFDIGMPEYSSSSAYEYESILQSVPPHFYETPKCDPTDEMWTADKLKCKTFPLARDAYLGFSTATSTAIEPNSDVMYYAAGAPRGNNTGAVVLFRKVPNGPDDMMLQPDYSNTVTVDRIGSSFGYSIAFVDINGDGRDDLIVGAPQYYEYSIKRKAGGAVYIYKNEGSGFRDVEPQVFYGPSDSFFGHAVAALGDIDQDGYGDFAVGSPYESEHGVIHIYRGSKDGKVRESQVIEGKDYQYVRRGNARGLYGFGASLSGAVDADSNKYPDLLIGSFTDYVALIRSRPIIRIELTFEIDKEEIDLDEKSCSSGGEDYSCFNIKYCFKYTARHGDYTGQIPIRYKLITDSNGKANRTHIDGHDGPKDIEERITLLQSDVEVCPGNQSTRDIYFGNRVRDHLTSIGMQIEFDLDFPEVQRERVGGEIFDLINDPVLDADFDKIVKKVVRIKNNCGEDGCQSDLKIKATMPEEIIVGDDTTLPVTVQLRNDGEEAHQSYFTVVLPDNVDYEDFAVKKLSNNSDIECYSSNTDYDHSIRCEIGNPYKSEAEVEIQIILGVSRLTVKDKFIQVALEGHTSSENPEIPPIYLRARVWIELDLSLTTSSKPQQVRYTDNEIFGESAMNTTEDIGPPIQYTFDILNEGSGPAAGVELNIDLPVEIINGKWLLYLVSSDVTAGGDVPTGKCTSKYENVLLLEPFLPAPTTRIKRQIVAEVSAVGGRTVHATLKCSKYTNCTKIRCLLDAIPGGTTTSVILQLRLWEATFLEEESLRQLDLVYVDTTAKLATSEENVRFKGEKTSGTVHTTVDHEFFKADVSSTFPWWYILLAVIALLLLYILIIFLLIKCGFFKRKRYPHRDNADDAVLEE